MLIKEWTIDDKGRILATWVQTESISCVECDAARETTTRASDSGGPATGPAENGVRASAPALELATAQGPRVHATSTSAAREGSWTRVFTVLRSILP